MNLLLMLFNPLAKFYQIAELEDSGQKRISRKQIFVTVRTQPRILPIFNEYGNMGNIKPP